MNKEMIVKKTSGPNGPEVFSLPIPVPARGEILADAL